MPEGEGVSEAEVTTSALPAFVPGAVGEPGSYGDSFVRALGGSVSALTARRDALFAGVPPEQRAEMAARHRKIVEHYQLPWYTECRMIARALGWEDEAFWQFLLLNDGFTACTSWIVHAGAGADGRMVLHKNRDYDPGGQNAMFHAPAGRYRWFGAGDLWRITPRMAINEAGLAVAMNAGDDCSDPDRKDGFSVSEVTKWLLETCGTVEEVKNSLRRLTADGYFRGGGTILFFIDPQGGAIAEMSPEHLVIADVPFGFDLRSNDWKLPGMVSLSERGHQGLMAEYRRELYLRRGLRRCMQSPEKIRLADIRALSRSRESADLGDLTSLCRSSTVSAATMVPDGEFPAELSCCWLSLGPVRNSLYVPVPMGLQAVPEVFADGRWAARCAEWQKQNGIDHDGDALLIAAEQEIESRYRAVEAEVRDLLRQGGTGKARDILRKECAVIYQRAGQFLAHFHPSPKRF